jgi:hypothetical protein
MVPIHKKFWYADGSHVREANFSFYKRKDEHYYGKEPKWYREGFLIQDDWGYTEGKDIWEDSREAAKVAKKYLAKQIQKKAEELETLFAHREELNKKFGSMPTDDLLRALNRAESQGKRVVCSPSHSGWSYEAWREDGKLHWRKNLGDGPTGPRGPIQTEGAPPEECDEWGWIVTAS